MRDNFGLIVACAESLEWLKVQQSEEGDVGRQSGVGNDDGDGDEDEDEGRDSVDPSLPGEGGLADPEP